MPVVEDTLGGGRIQSLGERRQHHCDLTGGSFQTVQGGVETGCESDVTGLAPMCVVCQEGKNLPFFSP
jgi:hypothetical protein